MIFILIIVMSVIKLIPSAHVYGDALELPDYDYPIALKDKGNLRERFLKSKEKSREKQKKNDLLDKYSDDTVIFEGIAHTETKNGKNLDNLFRQALAMEDFEYIYKRDAVWRTWRKVKFSKTNSQTIYYKCSSFLNVTCPRCQSGGFWIIEEKPPPCPFEIFSLINNDRLCVANYSQLHNTKDKCPSTIKYTDLPRTCDNPMETTYKMTRLFQTSKRKSNDICERRDYCEISTFYRIFKDFVLFRITNSTNAVVYSRIMKHNGKNYVCVRNCGRIDPKNKNITSSDTPLSFNLLEYHKNKRENEIPVEVTEKSRKHKKLEKKIKSTRRKIKKYGKELKKVIKSFREVVKTIKQKYLDSDGESTTTPRQKPGKNVAPFALTKKINLDENKVELMDIV